MSYRHEDAEDNETTDFNAKTTPDRPSFLPDVDPYTRRLDAELGPVQPGTTKSEPPNESFEDYINRMVREDKEAEACRKAEGALRL